MNDVKPWDKPEIKLTIDIFEGNLASIEQIDKREERIERDFIQRQLGSTDNCD